MAKRKILLDEIIPKLSSIVDPLTVEERELLLKSITAQSYKKNEIIYQEGDTPQYMHCLVSGKVKINKEGVGGRTQIVRVIRPVQYFGFRASFANQNYVNTAAAFEPTVIARIPIGTITYLIKSNAALAWFFIERLSVDLGRADERMVNLTQKHIQGRLAESLLFLKESYGLEEDGCTLSIYLSREDLANLSNMTTANAIRTLSAFATERIIACDGRKIKIIDELALEKISRLG